MLFTMKALSCFIFKSRSLKYAILRVDTAACPCPQIHNLYLVADLIMRTQNFAYEIS